MSQSNYGGKQANQSSYIKKFNIGSSPITWYYSTNNNQLILSPTNSSATVYIKGDLFVGGSINNPSDLQLKDNIEDLSLSLTDNLLLLNPVKYNYKDDAKQKEHYGFIAQDVEKLFPNLVNTVSATIGDDDVSIKSVNYLEMVPLLLLKIKDLQNQIDALNNKILGEP
uniref:Peptidase S74 domain-containing protein n=1 Tax=viral metagenome TaxID=1070528 RepID=A0A6C0JYU5_9ZZZZ